MGRSGQGGRTATRAASCVTLRALHDHRARGPATYFTFDRKHPSPQIGFHSTLIRDSQDSGKFDFFTKLGALHCRARARRPGEVYTLRFIEGANGNRVTLDYLSASGDASTLDAVTGFLRAALFASRTRVFFQRGRTVKRIIRLTGKTRLSGGNLLGLDMPSSTTTSKIFVKVTRKSPIPAGLNDERVQLYAYSVDQGLDRHTCASTPTGTATRPSTSTTTDRQLRGLSTFRCSRTT